jgi:hypothetical protein
MNEDKGTWAEVADEGIVPEPDQQSADPELRSEVTGREAASDAPATDDGIDMTAGDRADATEDGGPEGSDLKDQTAGPRQADADSAA